MVTCACMNKLLLQQQFLWRCLGDQQLIQVKVENVHKMVVLVFFFVFVDWCLVGSIRCIIF